MLAHGDAVHLRPVRRTEIHDDHMGTVPSDLSMPAGHIRIIEGYRTLWEAPDRDDVVSDADTSPVGENQPVARAAGALVDLALDGEGTHGELRVFVDDDLDG